MDRQIESENKSVNKKMDDASHLYIYICTSGVHVYKCKRKRGSGMRTGCLMAAITQRIEWAGTPVLTHSVTKYQNNVTNKYTSKQSIRGGRLTNDSRINRVACYIFVLSKKHDVFSRVRVTDQDLRQTPSFSAINDKGPVG